MAARAGVAPAGAPTGPRPPARARHRPRATETAGRLVERLLQLSAVRHLRAILDGYGEAGGGLLGAGLAFGAVFSLIPIVLLIAAASGFVIADLEVRRSLLEEIASRVPPLRQFISLALDALAQGAGGLSLLGLLGITWTSSQFYGQLDGAFALIFRNAPRRNLLERTVRGLVVLALALVGFVLLVGLSLVATVPLPIPALLEPVVKVASPVAGFLAVTGLVGVLYRVVPNRPIEWRAVWLPAATVAAAEFALTTLFVVIAPFLASARFFGPFVALFASFAWLSWSFQILLVGAAWVRERTYGEWHG